MHLVSVDRVRGWPRLVALLRFAGAGVLIPTTVLVVFSGVPPTAFIIAMGRVMYDRTAPHSGSVDMTGTLARAGTDLVLAFGALAGPRPGTRPNGCRAVPSDQVLSPCPAVVPRLYAVARSVANTDSDHPSKQI